MAVVAVVSAATPTYRSYPCRLKVSVQSSQIVSKSRSPLRSAPHTLHRFLLSREPNVRPRVLPLLTTLSRRFLASMAASSPSAASAAAFNRAILSASSAASSASGESGIVSKLEILGLRDLIELGVEGTDEEAYGTIPAAGKESLNLLVW